MDNFDITTGVLDSWDLLNPLFLDRNKESLQVSSLNLYTSSTSLLLKKTSYEPVFNSISAGYYPVFGSFYKTCPPTYEKPTVHVTVSPRTHQKTSNHVRNRQQTRKKTPNNTNHSLCSKKIYIVVPGTKKDKVYAIETTNAKIFKDINDNKILSECMIKDYIRNMNKSKKKISDRVKEKGNPLKTIPECSPGCGYMNMGRARSDSPDRSGSASPRSPVRSSYKTTKVESQQSITTTKTTKSPERLKVQDDSAKSKSPVRSNRPKTKLVVNQIDKDQNRKQESVSPERFSFISGKRSIESVIASEKRRSPERYEKRASSPARGRIRITGRLGIDEDDKCVLKCNATLNDEPIPTQIQGAACAMLPMCFQAHNEGNVYPIKQRDATVQAKEKGARFYSNEIRKESQATQVDFQIMYSTTKNRRDECGRGKVMQQCACVSTDDTGKEMPDPKQDTGVSLKKQHSPLIVISVYSKNASSESSGDIKQKHIKITGQKKETKSGRSRSPSPAKSPKRLGGKKSESHVNASTSKKTIRETAKKETKSKVNQSQSKSVVRSTTVTKSKFESKINKNKSSKNQKTPPQSRRSTSPITKEDEDKAELMKRALIEDFTKSYTEQINQRNAHLEIPLQTKHNVSNITIDIDGDSDYYNVKFEQDVGKMNTELIVRKSNGEGSNKRAGEVIMGETDTTSLENFLFMPEDEPRKRSFSQTLMFDGTEVTMNSDLGDENELNVKDSIEISHKREHKTSVDRERKEVGSKKFVPDKHFQGDDCSISDPDARDREIRRLLGIDKGVKKYRTRNSKSLDAFEKSSQAPVRSNLTTNTKIAISKKESKDARDTIVLARPLYLMNCKQNVQLLYHLRLRKPKRIVLSRSQYAKIKRAIFNSPLSKRSSRKGCNHGRRFHNSRLTIVKPDIKSIVLHSDKDCQTDNDDNTYSIHKIDATDANTTWTNCKFNSNSDQYSNEEASNVNRNQVINYNNYYMHNVLRTVYIAREHKVPILEGFNEKFAKKATSVKDIQYKKASRQRVRFSSSDTANYIAKSQEKRDAGSVQTLFKCHQKSITPNLGTSAYSLCNGEPCGARIKFFEDSVQDLAPKKPFLKRLISCLVFKVSQASEAKNPGGWLENGSPHSSFDSYHVSTSLGAIEMSSSLYDTTASFYSDHSTPAKIRRGFFSSVRGLLGRKH